MFNYIYIENKKLVIEIINSSNLVVKMHVCKNFQGFRKNALYPLGGKLRGSFFGEPRKNYLKIF